MSPGVESAKPFCFDPNDDGRPLYTEMLLGPKCKDPAAVAMVSPAKAVDYLLSIQPDPGELKAFHEMNFGYCPLPGEPERIYPNSP